MKNKRGVELVISTTVVIILGLLILIMGIFFTTKVMCTAMEGVRGMEYMNKQMLMDLYNDQKSNVLVKETENKIQMGVYYGVGFFITNEDRDSNSDFTYDVHVKDLGNCQISEQEAESYIVTGRTATVNIVRGKDYAEIIRFNIPRTASECGLKYEVRVENEGEFYGSASFDVIIKKTVWGSFCRA
jgi:hypothetical protein